MHSSQEITALCTQLVTEAERGGYKIVTVESLTAGLISGAIADIPGASNVLLAGFVTYDVRVKKMIGVPCYIIDKYGVVSTEVAQAMATCGLFQVKNYCKNNKQSADTNTVNRDAEKIISIAVTGVAGPADGTEAVPVGTVCFGLSKCVKEGIIQACSKRLQFSGSRNEVRQATVMQAVKMLLRTIGREAL